MDNYQVLLIIIGVLLVLGMGFVVFMARVSTDRVAGKFRTIASRAGYDVRKISLGFDVELYGKTGDVPFSVTFSDGNQYSPAHLHVTLFVTLPFSMSVKKENFYTGILKKTGVMHDIRTGVPEFDNRMCIISDNPEQCRSYLLEAERWKTLSELYERGWHPSFEKKKICFVKMLKAQNLAVMWVDLINEKELLDTLDRLAVMADG